MLINAATAAFIASDPTVAIEVDDTRGVYTILIDGIPWYRSPAFVSMCVKGKRHPLLFRSKLPSMGKDVFGDWKGEALTFMAGGSPVSVIFKQYAHERGIAVATMEFPTGVDASQCGPNLNLTTQMPAFDVSAARAAELHTVSWRGVALSTTAAARGLNALGANGLDAGPVASTDPSSGDTLVWSTLSSHKIVPQRTSGGVYSMGLSRAITSIPRGFSYSVLFSTARGGTTAGVYAWGARMRRFYNTTRSPSVTLTDVGYYTDDGAYYYVWEAFNMPARPWPAEDGLVRVKEALHAMGVPVAYMQLDDWWYDGPFYFGNVKAVVNWHASNSSRLFPRGLTSFADRLNLPLQLYTPFWSDRFQTKYNMTESTTFKGTKLVAPNDSYVFFSDVFDQGKEMTRGRFSTYEIDFLDTNFNGSASMMDDVHAADRWYAGMAHAALERGITIQYCLPSATDVLVSLSHPAVVQARASTDYVNPIGNVEQLGGSSLLMGALQIAPSKDTLWTRSPQPPTYSDTKTKGDYTAQPHVQLDAVLAVMSLGPVGISDGLNQTDAALIGQGFRSATDSTLLRPSRPLSTVDAVFANRSRGHAAADVRSTHAVLGEGGTTSHYVVVWRTTKPVTLQPTDLYPASPPETQLAVRAHVLAPSGPAHQLRGCVDGQPAVPSCVDLLAAGERPVLAATGSGLSDFSLTAIYEPLQNGAYFLGELTKFTHVSPQRFDDLTVAHLASTGVSPAIGSVGGPCGLVVGVRGAPGEVVPLVAIDPHGITHVSTVIIPAAGHVHVEL